MEEEEEVEGGGAPGRATKIGSGRRCNVSRRRRWSRSGARRR